MEKTKLTLEIIESYGMEKVSFKPDYDDAGYRFTLPKSGIEIDALFMCNGEPCACDILEGMDGYICIDSEEELKELMSLDYKGMVEKIKTIHPDFEDEDEKYG